MWYINNSINDLTFNEYINKNIQEKSYIPYFIINYITNNADYYYIENN